MRIRKRRIRSLDRHLRGIAEETEFVISVPVSAVDPKVLARIGFGGRPARGDQILPADVFGPISQFNANGKDIPLKTMAKETRWLPVQWTRQEWYGRDRREVSDTVYRRYERYQREHIAAPSVELRVDNAADGSMVIVSPPMVLAAPNNGRILHTINLYLEIFGFCDLLTDDLTPFLGTQVRCLNWRVLPPGRYPWDRAQPELEQRVLRHMKPDRKAVAEERLKVMTGYTPEFVAIGEGGFKGYIVFGFPKRHMFVLECLDWGNATYVLDDNWELVSQLSKADVLAAEFHRARIVHDKNWRHRIESTLGDTLLKGIVG